MNLGVVFARLASGGTILIGFLVSFSIVAPFRVGDEIKLDAFEGQVEEIQTRATIVKTYDERRVVIPNADLFTRSVVVNTALNTRRWEYDLMVNRRHDLSESKSIIVKTVRGLPGVLADPAPEALVADLSPDAVKLHILWWTRDTRQHEMLASYDLVLAAIMQSLGPLEPAKSEQAA